LDPDLRVDRAIDPDAVAKLPTNGQEASGKPWAEVAALLAKAEMK
jgi:hypothetical protein